MLNHPRVDILLVTYRKDAEWAEYCLKSIAKFSSGFGAVIIVCPESDKMTFIPMALRNSTKDIRMAVKTYIPRQGVEFNHHQVMKCYADVLCPDADMILHVDSDCIFTEPFTPQDYMVDGEPILPVRTYKAHEPCIVWKGITEKALGFICNYETMARHPAVHYRGMYKSLREHMEITHGIPFTEWVLMQPGNYPSVHFSEFNAMGSFIIWSEFDIDGRYHFIDLDKPGAILPPNKLIQGHSWGGVASKRVEFNRILNGSAKVR